MLNSIKMIAYVSVQKSYKKSTSYDSDPFDIRFHNMQSIPQCVIIETGKLHNCNHEEFNLAYCLCTAVLIIIVNSKLVAFRLSRDENMPESLKPPPPEELRKSKRVTAIIHVDVSEGAMRYSFGEVVDISRDGMAIQAFPLLTLNKVYRFHLRGYGTFSGKVVRRFGIKCHGIKFEIGEEAKQKIDTDILRM